MSDVTVTPEAIIAKPVLGRGHPEHIVQRIIDLARTGISRAAIATMVGGLSRSAVCGILARRGIKAPEKTKPAKPARRASTIRKPRTSPASVAVAVTRETKAPEGIARANPVTWADLDVAHQCCWPVGDRWCGEAKTDGSYCAGHFKLAYRRAA